MHPNLPALRRYLLGDLPPGEADSIERHMAGCTTCEETIHAAGLEQTADSLVETLRTQAEPLPFDRESELQEMLEKVRGLGSPPHGETIASVASYHDEAEPAAVAPGSLGEYDLGDVLGSGGMGTVYQAVHRRLRRRVAIKLLRADRTKDRAALDRFEREMEAVGRLEHPNIVRALDAGEANGTLYLAMEYVDGASVSAIAERGGTMPIAQACEIVRQAAIGLAAAHRAGLVHRDVKPGNLMLARTAVHTDDETATVTVKVLDLGLARMQGEASPGAAELTSAGQVMGTVDYMAPEQAESSRDVGPATDVYALGATLYRLLAGVSPLGLDPSAGLIQKLAALVASEPLPLETRRPDLPRSLCDLVRRTLSRDPAARPSAGELAKALQPFAVGADLGTLLDGTTGEEILDAALTDATNSLRPAGASDAAPVSGFATSHAISAPTKSAASGGRNGSYVAIGLAAASLFAAIVAGVMIFRIATDRGTIVVEIADPAIEAKLVAEGLKIVDAESGRDYVVRVAPSEKETANPQASGEYDAVAPTGMTLRVVGSDGLEIETNQFKLLRGATVRIKVYAEENASKGIAAAEGPKPAPDPSASSRLPAVDDGPGWLALANDRYEAKDFDGAIEAATKALSAGVEDRSAALRKRAYAYATRRILADSLSDLDLLVSRDANDAEALQLRSLVHRELGDVEKAAADAAAAAAIDPTQAELLRELPPASFSPNQELLAWISAHGGWFNDGVQTFDTSKGFTSVTFDPPAFAFVALGEGVDDETVELLRRTTRIEKLQMVSETRISDAGFARLCSSPSLSGLSELAVNVPRVTAEGWKRVASLEGLRSLNVQYHPCPPIPETLVELEALETLSLHDASGWSAEELAKLRDLPPTLRELLMGGPNVGGEPLLGIVANRPLRVLSLEIAGVSDADIAALAATETRETLEKLGVGSRVGDGLADSIRQFPKLQVLEINSAALTPEGFVNLGELPAVWLVNLHGTPIPREAVDAFREKNPRCTILSYPLGGIPSLEEERAGVMPANADVPAFDDGPGWLSLAKERYEAREFDGAIEAATRALAAGVDDRHEALRTRAFASTVRRMLPSTIDDLNAMLSADPQDAEALRLRSLVHREMDDAANADADAAQAAAIDAGIATKLAELPPASLSANQRVLKAVLAVGGHADVTVPVGTAYSFGPGRIARVTVDPAEFVNVGVNVPDPATDEAWILDLLAQANAISGLEVSLARLSSEGVERLFQTPSLAKLHTLNVSGASAIDEAGWSRLTSLNELRTLRIDGEVQPMGRSLAELKSLERLFVDASRWSDEDLARLRDLPPTLCELSLGGRNVQGETLLAIVADRPLEALFLETASVSDADVAALAESETRDTLAILAIGSPGVTDAVVESLRKFPKLTSFSFNESSLTPEGLVTLGELPGLVHLTLGPDRMPRDAIDAFREQNPHCYVWSSYFATILPLAQERAAEAESATP